MDFPSRSPRQVPNSFADLQSALLIKIHEQLHEGGLTVRGLAIRAGISQPHLHNMLHGARRVTPNTADRLLLVLGWTIQDLLPPSGTDPSLMEGTTVETLRIPKLAGAIGPGHSLSAEPAGHYTLPLAWASLLTDGVAAELVADPGWPNLFTDGDIAILDQSEMVRLFPNPTHHYVVELDGEMLIRRVRHQGNQVIFSSEAPNSVAAPERILEPGTTPLTKLLRARAVWFCNKHRFAPEADPSEQKPAEKASAATAK